MKSEIRLRVPTPNVPASIWSLVSALPAGSTTRPTSSEAGIEPLGLTPIFWVDTTGAELETVEAMTNTPFCFCWSTCRPVWARLY